MWVVSQHVDGQLGLETKEDALQWRDSLETDFQSPSHNISVMSVNNGTHIYFHLSWEDAHSNDDDGVAIFFEGAGAGGSDEIWYWGTQIVSDQKNVGVVSDGEWQGGKWMVVIGRKLSLGTAQSAQLEVGKAEEDFIKFAVWDGDKGESFAAIDVEMLEHANFVVLPFINIHPLDIYVWSSFILVGAVAFLFIESRNYRKRV